MVLVHFFGMLHPEKMYQNFNTDPGRRSRARTAFMVLVHFFGMLRIPKKCTKIQCQMPGTAVWQAGHSPWGVMRFSRMM